MVDDLSVAQPDYLSEAWQQNAFQSAESSFEVEVSQQFESLQNLANNGLDIMAYENAGYNLQNLELNTGGSILTGFIDAATNFAQDINDSMESLRVQQPDNNEEITTTAPAHTVLENNNWTPSPSGM